MSGWEWAALVGVLVVLSLVAWRLDVYRSLSRSGHDHGGPDTREAAAAAQQVLRDIQRGRSASNGMF
jgi:hypothetical protein